MLQIENEIDEAFEVNELLGLCFTQSAWTLLSVIEDHHFKIRAYNPLDSQELGIYTDGLLNALTYPMRTCLKKCAMKQNKFKRELVDDHYSFANEWIDKAEEYTHFCSIFPLYHFGEIDLKINGNNLIPTDWSSFDMSYEVYCRFIREHNPEDEIVIDPNSIIDPIIQNTIYRNEEFVLKFSPKLVKQLLQHWEQGHKASFTLPENWKFKYFSIQEFKLTFNTIQAMAYGWFLSRQMAAQKGLKALGYSSALWTPKKSELLARVSRYTGINAEKISKIFEYLTFGSSGVRNPDIAIQPLVDLKNGEYAISSFVWLNVNCERNLCVLLNQIKEEKKIYSKLVNTKEVKLRDEIIEELMHLGYDFKFGELEDTNLDLAIIDRKNKKCLAVELKWFIEPAEIREVIQRSIEIKKGISQAKIISNLYTSKDDHFITTLLKIQPDYDFLAIVASFNFIGNLSSQDSNIPVVKSGHLVSKLKSCKNLAEVMSWLRHREYLPKRDIDYTIQETPIKSGKWESVWYGIKHAT